MYKLTKKGISTKKFSPMQSQNELEFLERVSHYPRHIMNAHSDSKQEGFEFLFEKAGLTAGKSRLGLLMRLGVGGGLLGRLKVLRIFMKHQRNMMKGISECFSDLNPYIEELETTGSLKPVSYDYTHKDFPNEDLWNELSTYINQKWDIKKFGFTRLPNKLIFKDKAVFFEHVLVFIQEMDREKIEQAPDITAGEEVQRVYKTLGVAVNDIARWLRKKGFRCQSNHPLGGLVNTPPLAGKAGLGWRGFNGLLITPEFGQRQRIAPIFLEEKLFNYTDNNNHRWIEEYCNKCRRCQRKCPTQAILDEKIVSQENIEGIGSTITCIDREKCFPKFIETLGCSICIKVCPFSRSSDMYVKLQKTHEKH